MLRQGRQRCRGIEEQRPENEIQGQKIMTHEPVSVFQNFSEDSFFKCHWNVSHDVVVLSVFLTFDGTLMRDFSQSLYLLLRM